MHDAARVGEREGIEQLDQDLAQIVEVVGLDIFEREIGRRFETLDRQELSSGSRVLYFLGPLPE